ncbi:MAG: hypothetical protein HUK40_19695 [Desulfobacter sp.]|nr:hypothetical protein [Desulfobacter sp.]
MERDCGNFEFPVYTHNCTTPLLHTLRSYGYNIEKTKPMPIGEGNKLHVAEIKKLTDKIDEINASAELPDWMTKNDAVLFCPSIYAPLFKVKHKLWKDLFRQLGKEGREFLKNALIRNQGYGNSTMHAKDISNPYNPYADPMVNVLLMERQKELHLFTNIISIISTNQFTPAIRLPNSLMLHHGKLKEIATIITNSTKNRLHKLNKKLISYNHSLRGRSKFCVS